MRRKIFVLILVTVFTTVSISAQTTQTIFHEDIQGVNPRIMGMGNGTTAHISGLQSLSSNPAGLAKSYVSHLERKSEITAFAISFWTQPYPSDFFRALGQFFDGDSAGLDVFSTTGGRLGLNIYGGYLTQNIWGSLGFSLSSVSDIKSFTYSTYDYLTGTGISKIQFAAAYAYEFNLSGILLRLGASIRPLVQTHNTLTKQNVFSDTIGSGAEPSAILDELDGLHGFAVAQDIGLQLEWVGISLGVDLHNAYAPIFYTEAPITNFLTSFSGNTVTESYSFPFTMNFAIAYNLEIPAIDWLEQYFDFTIYFQLTDPFYSTIQNNRENPSFYTRINAGIEFELLKPFIKVQAGLNKGGGTIGMGFDVWWIDVSFAIYTEEEGRDIRERTSAGFATEIAIRW